jgi:hypothetical protein
VKSKCVPEGQGNQSGVDQKISHGYAEFLALEFHGGCFGICALTALIIPNINHQQSPVSTRGEGPGRVGTDNRTILVCRYGQEIAARKREIDTCVLDGVEVVVLRINGRVQLLGPRHGLLINLGSITPDLRSTLQVPWFPSIP